ncbi:MAG TPA: MmcQ/YjbR family DNA-binding protein [Actinocatenispora sp.]
MAGATFELVRSIALALPGAEEARTWGTETAFQVTGKMFAVAAPDEPYATVKAAPAEQAALVAADPETYSVAPTTGRFGWVRIELSRIDPAALRELIVTAWRSTAPRRLTTTYEDD